MQATEASPGVWWSAGKPQQGSKYRKNRASYAIGWQSPRNSNSGSVVGELTKATPESVVAQISSRKGLSCHLGDRARLSGVTRGWPWAPSARNVGEDATRERKDQLAGPAGMRRFSLPGPAIHRSYGNRPGPCCCRRSPPFLASHYHATHARGTPSFDDLFHSQSASGCRPLRSKSGDERFRGSM